MGTSVVELDATVVDLTFTEDFLRVTLADGRELSAPLAWFPRLRDASPEQRAANRLIGKGHGIHWPELEKISRSRACCA